MGVIRRKRERRAAEAAAARREYQLRTATDVIISQARRTLMDRMPNLPLKEQLLDRERVDVQDVRNAARTLYGLDIPREEAAAMLRARYEHRSGRMDLITDAYNH